MPPSRRSMYFVAVILFLTIAVLHLRSQKSASWPRRGWLPTSSGSTDKEFHWRNVPLKHPVETFIPLPESVRQPLRKVQFHFPPENVAHHRSRIEKRNMVKAAIQRSWRAYKKYAWLKDELSPMSKDSRTAFSGWGATLVDSLDTLWIAGLKREFEDAVEAVDTIDFSNSTEYTINVFETNIRYLGGLLGAFDLAPRQILLNKAIEVAEMLYRAFDTPNGMPVTRWNISAGKSGADQSALERTFVSEIGSLSLEFTRLSQIIGHSKYFDAVQKVANVFDQQQAKTSLPGLWPKIVNAESTNFTEYSEFTFGAMADSLYEYFPKQYSLLTGGLSVYQKLYRDSMKAAKEHILFRPLTKDNADILFAGDAIVHAGGQIHLSPRCQHLTCFAGGMYALGGRLFDIPEHVSIGRRLTNGCVWAYDQQSTGIMPEIFTLVPCKNISATADCTLTDSAWHEAVRVTPAGRAGATPSEIISRDHLPPGFTSIESTNYSLRPEAIESVFILYRITGDTSLLDTAWRMFLAIERATRTEEAYTEIDDVTSSAAPEYLWKSDRMQSFWLAETLKYFYLMFSEPTLLSLDEWVFNTEAHPFRLSGPYTATATTPAGR